MSTDSEGDARQTPDSIRFDSRIRRSPRTQVLSNGRYVLKEALFALVLTLAFLGGSAVQAVPALELNVVLPAVRGNIQSKDPVKKLVVDGLVTYTGSEKLTVDCRGVDAAGKTVATAKARVFAGKNFRMALSIRRLPVGDYKFAFSLMVDGRNVTSQVMPITVAPPATTEVTFDDKRVCYVNGKPFFPIGLYHVSSSAVDLINQKSRPLGLPDLDLFDVIKQLKDVGFNTIHNTWTMPGEEYLAYTESLGMYVIPEVGSPTAENVALANRHSNVLMWYGRDEPTEQALDGMKRGRAQALLLDPHRPVSAAVNHPDMYKLSLEGFDFLMLDIYPVRQAPMSLIADRIELAKQAGKGTKAVWLVSQAFGIDTWGVSEPTPEELLCQAYVGLVHGATGLIWYAFWSPEDYAGNVKGRNCWVLSDSRLWDTFPKLNAEVSALAPIILTGRNLGPVKCSSTAVHTCLWTYKGKSYLLAVNTQYEPATCIMEGFRHQAEVMFEDRSVTTKGGTLIESFKPLEAHVYRF